MKREPMDDDDELRSPKKRIADFAVYLVVRFFVAVVQALPYDMANSLCQLLANVLCRWVPVRRKTFYDNMRRVFPESSAAQRQALCASMWHHLLLMVCEIAWAPRRMHLSNWTKHFRLRDNRSMLQHLLSGRPTILVTGHFGNFEVCGYTIGLMGFPTVTIARRLDNAYLHEFLEDFRGTHGQFMVDKEGCAPLIERHLANNGTLSLLADQHAGEKGCWVEFLGAPASCHKALALFSLSSGAPMIVGYTRRLGKPMQFESGSEAIADPADDKAGVCAGVRPLTQWYSDKLGDTIMRAPEQYWWVHRRWRDKAVRVKASAAKAA